MASEKELFKIAEKIYHQNGESRYPKAIAAFRDLLEQYPMNIEGWGMISTMQSCFKAYDEAIASIEKAIKLAPHNVSLWNQKNTLLHEIDGLEFNDSKYCDLKTGNVYEIKRFKDKTDLRKEILLGCETQLLNIPKDDCNLGNLLEEKGKTLTALGEYDAAIEAYQNAVNFHNEHYTDDLFNPVAHCYFEIAKVYELQNKLTTAIEYYDKSFAEGNEEIILTHKARTFAKMGDKMTSEEVLADFLGIVTEKFTATSDAAYMFQIVDSFRDQGQFDKALQTLEKMSSKAKKYSGLQERISELRSELLQLKPETTANSALPKAGRTWLQKLFGSE